MSKELKEYHENVLHGIDQYIKGLTDLEDMGESETKAAVNLIQVLSDFRRMMEYGFRLEDNTLAHALCVLLSDVASVLLNQPTNQSCIHFMKSVKIQCDMHADEHGRKFLNDLILAAMPTHKGGLQ